MNLEQLELKKVEYQTRIEKANENLRFNGGDITAITAISNMKNHLKRIETEIVNYVEPIIEKPEKLQPFEATLENMSDLKASQTQATPPELSQIPQTPAVNSLDSVLDSAINSQLIPTEQTLSLETPFPTSDQVPSV